MCVCVDEVTCLLSRVHVVLSEVDSLVLAQFYTFVPNLTQSKEQNKTSKNTTNKFASNHHQQENIYTP